MMAALDDNEREELKRLLGILGNDPYDFAALHNLILIFGNQMNGFIYRVVQNTRINVGDINEFIKDTRNDAFLRIVERAKIFDPEKGKPDNWLFGITLNVTRENLRPYIPLNVKWNFVFEYLYLFELGVDDAIEQLDRARNDAKVLAYLSVKCSKVNYILFMASQGELTGDAEFDERLKGNTKVTRAFIAKLANEIFGRRNPKWRPLSEEAVQKRCAEVKKLLKKFLSSDEWDTDF